MLDPTRIPAKIAQLASSQQRQVTRAQLLDLGLSSSAIARRVNAGLLYRQHPGVFSVGCPALTPIEVAAAATLACGTTGVLGELWAMALWDFDDWPTGIPTVLTRIDRNPDAVNTRRVCTLPQREIRIRHGIPVTCPARTIVDSAPLLPLKRRSRLINEALRTSRLDRRELVAIRAAHPRLPGARLLGRYLDTADGPADSPWEDEFPILAVAHGLPRPRIKAVIAGHTVDILFPNARLIVELDGWDTHHTRDAFESDRDRDADTLAAGYITVRITWERIEQRPVREFARLKQIIERRTR